MTESDRSLDDIAQLLNEIVGGTNTFLIEKFGLSVRTQVKEDTSLVTEVDIAAEKLIKDAILKAWPTDQILAEESQQRFLSRTPGSYVWIIDPLDGTTNFAHGYPFFSVSIACARFRADSSLEILAGAIGEPCAASIYTAVSGRGAYLNGQRIHVRPPRAAPEQFIVTGFYYHRGEQLSADMQLLSAVMDQCQSVRRDGSAALDLAYVARGVYDGFWERGLQLWDLAAGSLLVTEAGGQLHNFTTESVPYDLEGDGIVAGTEPFAGLVRGSIASLNLGPE